MSVTDHSLQANEAYASTFAEVLIHHRDCGMLTFADDDVKAQIEQTQGSGPPSPSKRSGMWKLTCANRWAAFRPARFSPMRTCEGLCSTSPRASSTK